MLSVTDTAFNFLILQLVLHTSDLSLLLFRILAPVCARSEDDIFAHAGGI